jgi:hypothetical protein
MVGLLRINTAITAISAKPMIGSKTANNEEDGIPGLEGGEEISTSPRGNSTTERTDGAKRGGISDVPFVAEFEVTAGDWEVNDCHFSTGVLAFESDCIFELFNEEIVFQETDDNKVT